jgi:tRNA-Thr(GGU) m(6)t(6)A37 methyltransferase TsaA
MNNSEGTIKEKYHLYPIGYVRRGEDGSCSLEILAPYRPGLKQLDQFSHVVVFWWADQHDNQQGRSLLQTRPPYAEDKLTGVFACRSEYRPNPIAMTTCQILGVDEDNGRVQLANIDAYDGTGVVDLKAYFPVCDRVQEAHIPNWLSDWPDWIPAEGIGLWD